MEVWFTGIILYGCYENIMREVRRNDNMKTPGYMMGRTTGSAKSKVDCSWLNADAPCMLDWPVVVAGWDSRDAAGRTGPAGLIGCRRVGAVLGSTGFVPFAVGNRIPWVPWGRPWGDRWRRGCRRGPWVLRRRRDSRCGFGVGWLARRSRRNAGIGRPTRAWRVW